MDTKCATEDGFSASRQRFDQMLGFLDSEPAGTLSHGELEDQLASHGRELLRLLYQDHLDLRQIREARVEVIDVEGQKRGRVERGCVPRMRRLCLLLK